MDSQKHVVISSELIYKWEALQIILKTCHSLLNNTVFFSFYRRNFKPRADDGRKTRYLNTISSFHAKSPVSFLMSCPQRLTLFSINLPRK